MCDEAAWIEPRSLSFVPRRFKTEGLCIKTVRKDPYALDCVPENLKTQKICNEAVRKIPAAFFLVPDFFKTQELCIMAVNVDPWQLHDIPDYLKTQKNVWRCGAEESIFFVVSFWLVCYWRTNKNMGWWRSILWRWWTYWEMRWLL